jgi:hypothetical protein
MRRINTLFVLGLLLVVLLACGLLSSLVMARRVAKPIQDGQGPLAVKMDESLTAPPYHSPLEWWQTHHPTVLDKGDLRQADCLYCHDPKTSCDNCHDYVGAKHIEPLP